MKTFAYLALIGSAMAVRLMEDAPKPTVEDAESIHDVAELRLDDLEGEMEGLGECFGKGTKEALEEVELASEEIEELGKKLEDGAKEGRTLGEAVELLREKAREHDVGTTDQEEFLGGVLEKVKRCKRERRGDKSGSGSDGEGSVEEMELAQTGEEDSVDMEDAKEFTRKAKAEPVSAKLGAISQSLPESPSLHRPKRDLTVWLRGVTLICTQNSFHI